MATIGFSAANSTPVSSALAEINGNTGSAKRLASNKNQKPVLGLNRELDDESDSEVESSSPACEPAPNDNIIVKTELKVENAENQTPSPSPGLPELRPPKRQGRAASEAHLRKRAYDVADVPVSSPARASESRFKKRSYDVANTLASSPAYKKQKTRGGSKSGLSTKKPAWMFPSQSSSAETSIFGNVEVKSNDRPTQNKPRKDTSSKGKTTKDKTVQDKPTQDKSAQGKPTKSKPTQDKPAIETSKSNPLTPKHYLSSDSLIQALDGRFYFHYRQEDGSLIETHKVPLPSYYKALKDTEKPFCCPVTMCGKWFAGFKNLAGHFAAKHINRAFRDNCNGTMTEVGSCSRKVTGRLGLIVSRTKSCPQPPLSLGRSFFQNMIPWPLRDTSGKVLKSKVLSYIDSQWIGGHAVPSGLNSVLAMADITPRRGLPTAWTDYYEKMPMLPLQYAYTVAYLTGKEISVEEGCEQARTWGHLSPACVELPQLEGAALEELDIFKGCVTCRYHSALAGFQIKCDLNRGKMFPELLGQPEPPSGEVGLCALNKPLPIETPVPLPPQLSSASKGASEQASGAVEEPSPDTHMEDLEAVEVDEPIIRPPEPTRDVLGSPSLPSLDQIQQELLSGSSTERTSEVEVEQPGMQPEIVVHPTDNEDEDECEMPGVPPAVEDGVPDSPATRSTRSSAVTPSRHGDPEITLERDMDEQQEDGDDMQMEPWETAPGRVEDSQGKNIGFSNGYVIGSNPVSIAPDIDFNIVIIKPGDRHYWDSVGDRQRICSVAQGKIKVQIGESRFKLGESGAFTIYPGETCAIEKNMLYRDVVLHCTTIGKYQMRRGETD